MGWIPSLRRSSPWLATAWAGLGAFFFYDAIQTESPLEYLLAATCIALVLGNIAMARR